MKHQIIDKQGVNVGYATVLDDGDLSITFHDVWVGAFSTFEGWNCQHGLAYTLVVPIHLTNPQYNFLEMRDQFIQKTAESCGIPIRMLKSDKPDDEATIKIIRDFNFTDISLVAEGGIPPND